jgi:hypothetical protein
MPRPAEYDNLVRAGYFHDQPPTPGFLEQYLLVAAQCLDGARNTSHPTPAYLLAYEGFFQIVQAVLEHYGVRAVDRPGHRIVAIQRVCADLQLSPGQQKLITDAHSRRNETVYRAPLPPVSLAEAKAMISILEASLPLSKKLTGAP